MVGLLILVFTVDVQFTFCCETCGVLTLVGMHNIYALFQLFTFE